jgi:hypothetical protein
MAIIFCAAAPDSFMFSVWNMLHVKHWLISFEEQLKYRCLDTANYRKLMYNVLNHKQILRVLIL